MTSLICDSPGKNIASILIMMRNFNNIVNTIHYHLDMKLLKQ